MRRQYNFICVSRSRTLLGKLIEGLPVSLRTTPHVDSMWRLLGKRGSRFGGTILFKILIQSFRTQHSANTHQPPPQTDQGQPPAANSSSPPVSACRERGVGVALTGQARPTPHK